MPEAVSEAADNLGGNLSIHSFIIRMWLEEGEDNTRREIWRGRITHIPGNEQKYFADLNEISVFIKSHLDEQSEINTH